MLTEKLLTDIGTEESDAKEILQKYGECKDKILPLAKEYLSTLNTSLYSHYTAQSSLDSFNRAKEYIGKVLPLFPEENEYLIQLVAWAALLPFVCENYKKAGLDYETFCNNSHDLVYKIGECKSMHKCLGVFVKWFYIFMELRLFELGRLQYELTSYPLEDYTFGEYTLKKNAPVYSMHIPTSKNPFTTQACYDSLDRAYRFFKPQLDGDILPVMCASWLLYTPYAERVYKEGSNLLNFYNLFDILQVIDTDSFGDSWRVFNTDSYTDTSSLPANTSLQRSFIKYINEVNKYGVAYGMILYDGKNKKIINI